jgi:hypothetical protein
MTESVRITKDGTYAEIRGDGSTGGSTEVTKSGAYVEVKGSGSSGGSDLVTEFGCYIELILHTFESVFVTKAGAYGELSGSGSTGGSDFVTEFGVYVEIFKNEVRVTELGSYVEETGSGASGGSIFVTEEGVYVEILPPDPSKIKLNDGLSIFYNHIRLDDFINTFSLSAVTKILPSDTFLSLGVVTPSLTTWVLQLTGVWGKTLDDIFGTEVIVRTSSETKVNCRVILGAWGHRVVYDWVAEAFVQTYTLPVTLDVLVFNVTIALSGPPSRGTN